MAERLLLQDVRAAIAERLWPSVTIYNRLEGRPRSVDLERSLRAEVHDPLWALTRQWQVGEFEADDAGSPYLSRMVLAHRQLNRYRPFDGPPVPLPDELPLEALVERRPIGLTQGGREIQLSIRLLLGRQWLRMIDGIGTYRDAFIDRYEITEPDPDLAADADQAAHAESLQVYAALAGRAMDGGSLLEHLADPTHHAYDGVVGVQPVDRPAIDVQAGRFVAWFARLFAQPDDAAGSAWDPTHLDYRFELAATDTTGERGYASEGYTGGRLDWWALDRVQDLDSLANPTEVLQDPTDILHAPVPTEVRFEGMPNHRWWAFEDSKTNLGDVDATTTDLAKLLFLEFGLVYANDWLIVPVDLPAASVADVRGLAVTNVFGERFWIEPAGAGPADAWQRWSMFDLRVRGQAGAAADTSLVLLPTVPKIQEGETLEQVVLIRDEMANMVWGVEQTVLLPTGVPKPGREAEHETVAYLERVAGTPPAGPAPARVAAVRYAVMSGVPENWIPFIPVHVPGGNRDVRLQRAAMPRRIKGLPVAKIRPRTSLLREGLDEGQRYFVNEEEVPRAGTVLKQRFQRTRWHGGRVVTWLGISRDAGRGEGSSGLAFDYLVDMPPEET